MQSTVLVLVSREQSISLVRSEGEGVLHTIRSFRYFMHVRQSKIGDRS